MNKNQRTLFYANFDYYDSQIMESFLIKFECESFEKILSILWPTVCDQGGDW